MLDVDGQEDTREESGQQEGALSGTVLICGNTAWCERRWPHEDRTCNLTVRNAPAPPCPPYQPHSKTRDGHRAAVASHIACYHWCRVQERLRVTPAMERRLTNHSWTLAELIERAAVAKRSAPPRPRGEPHTAADPGREARLTVLSVCAYAAPVTYQREPCGGSSAAYNSLFRRGSSSLRRGESAGCTHFVAVEVTRPGIPAGVGIREVSRADDEGSARPNTAQWGEPCWPWTQLSCPIGRRKRRCPHG